MVHMNVDGREFDLVTIHSSIPCTINPDEGYTEFYFKENGKSHICQQTMKRNENGDYVIEQGIPAKWYVEE